MITTKEARENLGAALDACRIARHIGQSEHERVFSVHVAEYLCGLQRSQNANECALGSRIRKLLVKRDYDAALQAWEGRT